MKLSANAVVVVLAALVTTAVVTVPVPQAVAGTDAVFRTACKISHSLPDDPIVFPRKPGVSHLHDFFANKTTDAFSTYKSLRAGATTCKRPEDTAAYWVPAAYQSGQKMARADFAAYYRGGNKEASTIQAFPAGLRIIAGDARATKPQDGNVVRWGCGFDATWTDSSTTPCPLGTRVHLRLRFPDCWDGRNLDSPDHKSHMAYAVRDGGVSMVCPASHAVPVPQLELNINYPDMTGGPGMSLASGSPNTAHADFVNAWDQAVLERLVRHCLRSGLGTGMDVYC